MQQKHRTTYKHFLYNKCLFLSLTYIKQTPNRGLLQKFKILYQKHCVESLSMSKQHQTCKGI